MGKRPPYSDIESGAYRKCPPPPPPPPPPSTERYRSWLVPLIFAVNITMFVYTMYVNDCPAKTGPDRCLFYDYLGRYSFQPLTENPVLGPSITTLHNLGALDPIAIVNEGETWRFFSCVWLHAGVAHLFANMTSLLFIGIRLEEEFGFLRIGALYLISGFGGSLMSSLNTKPNISVGASGALLGLLGCMLSELLINWTIYVNKCAAISSLLLIIALNLALGLVPRVDNSAHMGGFFSGFLLGFILLMRPQYGYVSRNKVPAGYYVKRKPKHKCYQYILFIAALIVLITWYIWGLITLFSGHRFPNPTGRTS
ncbi:RHOMBOID-like protein 5 [Euphorbia lathyris]|uniref:RHOMBOID-like protein 5 n=1 Tax=Euphorbia lathyris TaxID=212925 RepID=UPI003313D69F